MKKKKFYVGHLSQLFREQGRVGNKSFSCEKGNTINCGIGVRFFDQMKLSAIESLLPRSVKYCRREHGKVQTF